MNQPIRSQRDLNVYQTALVAALFASKLARACPGFERDLRDQLTRAARAVGAAVAEAWPKRAYPHVWRNKLSDAQSEACEAQWWIEIAYNEGYCTAEEFKAGLEHFEHAKAQLARMFGNAAAWHTSTPRGRRS